MKSFPAKCRYEDGKTYCSVCNFLINDCKCLWSIIRELQDDIRKCVSVDGFNMRIQSIEERLIHCEMKVSVHREASFTERVAADKIMHMDERIKALEKFVMQLLSPEYCKDFKSKLEKLQKSHQAHSRTNVIIYEKFKKIEERLDHLCNCVYGLNPGLDMSIHFDDEHKT